MRNLTTLVPNALDVFNRLVVLLASVELLFGTIGGGKKP